MNNLGPYWPKFVAHSTNVLYSRIQSNVSIALGTKNSYFWNIAQSSTLLLVLFVACFMMVLGEKKDKMLGLRAVNTGQKMKNAGKEKYAKLVQHFTLPSNMSVQDDIDILLDRRKRKQIILEEQDHSFNT